MPFEKYKPMGYFRAFTVYISVTHISKTNCSKNDRFLKYLPRNLWQKSLKKNTCKEFSLVTLETGSLQLSQK